MRQNYKMPRKKLKLNHPVTQNHVGILPREILCIIFSYLEQREWHSASETCKLWFELIRNDPNLSNQIFLKSVGLKKLQYKIEESEWIWNRWPVLKVLELRHPSTLKTDEPESLQEVLDLVKSINFQGCSTLEKVVFTVNFDLIDFFPNFPHHFNPSLRIATVKQLTFNPQSFDESHGTAVLLTEDISVLHIRVCDEDKDRFYNFNRNISKFLADTIQTVQLTVRSIFMIKYVSNVLNFITDLYVQQLFSSILKMYVSNNAPMFQQLKKLKKCHVNVTIRSDEDWHYFKIQGPLIVNEKFRDMTEVKFVFKYYSEVLEVTKMPFGRSVSKLIGSS